MEAYWRVMQVLVEGKGREGRREGNEGKGREGRRKGKGKEWLPLSCSASILTRACVVKV